MSVPLTFLEPARSIKLAKTITKDGSLPYPLAKMFTSHVVYLSPDEAGLREAFTELQARAIKGHAIHKGVLKEQLVNEQRKGKSDPHAPTNLLVIDLDDYVPDVPLPNPTTSADLAVLVDNVRAQLPAPLNTCACIGNASASTGMKASGAIGLHLFFLLDKPVAPAQLNLWLMSLNFSITTFASQLKLNPSGISLKYVVDPVVARNAQIIYIAPPELKGVPDPFKSPSDRWALLDGQTWTADISPLLLAVVPAAVQKLASDTMTTCRKALGLAKHTPRYRKLTVDGERLDVLTNPDHMQMTLVRTTDAFAYWNINGGDSAAYYNPLANPEIVFNFKGEPPFEMRAANEDVYNWYCEKFKTEIRDVSDPKPLVFRHINGDVHYAVEYNPREDLLLRVNKIQRVNVDDWFASYGLPTPDPIPQWDMGFNPRSTVVIDWENKHLNTFQPTNFLRNPPVLMPQHTGVSLGHSIEHLPLLCPLIHRVIFHICGSSATEYEWLMNWLAYIIQTRNKTGTAWVFNGVPGTGKGVFFDHILAPIIGEKYAVKKRLDHLEDKFNAYVENAIFLAYDEFRLSDSGKGGRLLDQIKNDITEKNTTVRAMRTDGIEVANFTNYLFFSNHLDVIRIEDGDRRFNVAPAQHRPLRSVWPNLTDELHLISSELGTFAGFLMAFNVNTTAATTCIENEAKLAMKTVSMGYNERFCAAVRAGQLDYFIQVFDMDIANDLTRATQVTTAQKYVRAWAGNANGEACRIAASELLTVFIAMHDPKPQPTQVKFSQMLLRNDITLTRQKHNGDKRSCLTVKWVSKQLLPSELAEIANPSVHREAFNPSHH